MKEIGICRFVFRKTGRTYADANIREESELVSISPMAFSLFLIGVAHGSMEVSIKRFPQGRSLARANIPCK